DRRLRGIGDLGGGVDVVVVRVRAHDRDEGPVPDRLEDRGGLVPGVQDDALAVVADDPDVVVDLPRATVELEGAGGDDLVDARGHRITTERRTSPACILVKAD